MGLKTVIGSWVVAMCAAGTAVAGAIAPPPQADNSSGGEGAVLLLLLLGAVIVAANAGKPKTQPTIVDDEAEAGDGKY